MPACDLNLILADGRRLAYAEFGTQQGMPVIYLHGTPGSRLEPLIIGDDVLAGAGLRLIAFDRPGLGGSDFLPGRTISGITKDVSQLASHLGLDRFSVLGVSGGGPYAAACAAGLPDRIKAAVIVSGAWTWAEFGGAVRIPAGDALVSFVSDRLPYTLLRPLQLLTRLPPGLRGRCLALLRSFFPEPDRLQLREAWRLEALMAAVNEAVRPGLRGAAWDMRLIERRYDFDCRSIRTPVHIFHGTLDRNVSLALVQAYAKKIPRAKLTVFPQEGHLSTLCGHFAEIAAAQTSGIASD
jgi:pimeloyl-ACP methyl ester carboxylesterase